MDVDTLKLVIYLVGAVMAVFSFLVVYRLHVVRYPEPRPKKKAHTIGTIILGALFLVSGLAVVFMEYFPEASVAKAAMPVKFLVFRLHLFVWMLIGMAFNYLWDHFRAGRRWEDIKAADFVLPFLVSPIIFFTIWSIASKREVDFILALIAFQNGFFWQAIFAKAGPILPAQAAVSSGPGATQQSLKN